MNQLAIGILLFYGPLTFWYIIAVVIMNSDLPEFEVSCTNRYLNGETTNVSAVNIVFIYVIIGFSSLISGIYLITMCVLCDRRSPHRYMGWIIFYSLCGLGVMTFCGFLKSIVMNANCRDGDPWWSLKPERDYNGELVYG